MAQAVDASPPRSWFRRQQIDTRPTSPFAPGHWEQSKAEPELAKALCLIQGRVAEARALLELNTAEPTPHSERTRSRLLELLTRDVDSLTTDSAWELANQLKLELLFLGDKHYVWARLDYECERTKKAGHWHGWSDHFGEQKLHDLIDAGKNGAVDAGVQAEAIHHLRLLYTERAEAGLERRVRAQQKLRYLNILALALIFFLVLLSGIVQWIGGGGMWESIVLVVSAGALGATLAGTFRVRDKLVQLDDLRSFWPAMRVQPLVGAVAGLVILLVLESGAVALGNGNTASWAAQALFAFAAGFSEPFFLGVVQKVAVLPDKDNDNSKKR